MRRLWVGACERRPRGLVHSRVIKQIIANVSEHSREVFADGGLRPARGANHIHQSLHSAVLLAVKRALIAPELPIRLGETATCVIEPRIVEEAEDHIWLILQLRRNRSPILDRGRGGKLVTLAGIVSQREDEHNLLSAGHLSQAPELGKISSRVLLPLCDRTHDPRGVHIPRPHREKTLCVSPVDEFNEKKVPAFAPYRGIGRLRESRRIFLSTGMRPAGNVDGTEGAAIVDQHEESKNAANRIVKSQRTSASEEIPHVWLDDESVSRTSVSLSLLLTVTQLE
jgi:hypothetical protein